MYRVKPHHISRFTHAYFELSRRMANCGEAGRGRISDPAHLLVESATPTNVDMVVVDGRILKRNGKLTHIDVDGLTEETAAAFDSLRKRANWRSGAPPKPR